VLRFFYSKFHDLLEKTKQFAVHTLARHQVRFHTIFYLFLNNKKDTTLFKIVALFYKH